MLRPTETARILRQKPREGKSIGVQPATQTLGEGRRGARGLSALLGRADLGAVGMAAMMGASLFRK